MKTVLGVLVDRSGSMSPIKDDMTGGVKNFIKDQAKEDGECDLILSHFDDHYRNLYNGNIKDYGNNFELIPRGSTALCDSIMKISSEIDENIKKNGKPDHIILMIVTDGYENASKEVNKDQIKELVLNREKDGWNILYLGGGDAFYEREEIGINLAAAVQYNANRCSTNNAFKTSSDKVKFARSLSAGSKVSAYTDDERAIIASDSDMLDWEN